MNSKYTLLLFCYCLLGIHLVNAQFTRIQGNTGIIDPNVAINYFDLNASGLDCNHIADGTCMDINHPDLASLSIALIAPDGTSVLLTENQVSGTVFDNTCFNLGSPADISTASSPYTAFYQPLESISAVNNGQDLNGTWQLAISFTNAVTSTGTLDFFEMGFFSTGTDPCTEPPTSTCPSVLEVNSTSGASLFNAADSIYSDAIITSTENVIFQAGTAICLNDGFEVQVNGEFLAEIQGCGSAVPAGESSFTIAQTIDGVVEDRPVYLRAPATIDPNVQYPLLFYFHGSGGNASQYYNNGSLNTIIENENVIGVYPQGFNNVWNLGPESSNADELEFIDLIFAELANYTNIDFTKVYGIGSSNGAAVLNEFGRQRAYFNAIAPIVSQLNVNQALVTPPRAIAVYQVNGDMDGLIPVDGGSSAVGQTFLSAQASAEDWAAEFSCDVTPNYVSDTWGSDAVDSYFYNNCTSGLVVSYHIVIGGTHGLGGGDPNFTQRIWDFLKLY